MTDIHTDTPVSRAALADQEDFVARDTNGQGVHGSVLRAMEREATYSLQLLGEMLPLLEAAAGNVSVSMAAGDSLRATKARLRCSILKVPHPAFVQRCLDGDKAGVSPKQAKKSKALEIGSQLRAFIQDGPGSRADKAKGDSLLRELYRFLGIEDEFKTVEQPALRFDAFVEEMVKELETTEAEYGNYYMGDRNLDETMDTNKLAGKLRVLVAESPVDAIDALAELCYRHKFGQKLAYTICGMGEFPEGLHSDPRLVALDAGSRPPRPGTDPIAK